MTGSTSSNEQSFFKKNIYHFKVFLNPFPVFFPYAAVIQLAKVYQWPVAYLYLLQVVLVEKM